MNSAVQIVLLVEGDIVVRFLVAQYLRQCGLTVVEAVNGEEARTALNSPELKIGFVLANMTAQNVGFDLRRWARAKNPNLQVILVTSIDKIVERAGSLCNEGPALAKPYEHHLVRDEIRQAIARRERALQGDEGEKSHYVSFAGKRR